MVEQVIGNGDEVGEGVAFVQHFAVVVPVAAELAATPDVGEREDHAQVHEGEAGNRESRVEGDFVGTVAVEDGGGGVGKVHVAAMHQRDGNVHPIACGDPHAAGHIVVRVIAAQDFLFLEQPQLAGSDGVIVDAGGGDVGGIGQSQHGGIPFGVAHNLNGVELFGELKFDEFSEVSLVQLHHAGVDAFDADGIAVRHQNPKVIESA